VLQNRAGPRFAASALVLSAVMPPAAAEGVAATSRGAVVLAAAASPTSANKGANIANIVAAVDCAYSEDALATSPAEVFFVFAVGTSPLRHFIGGVLFIPCVLFAAFGAQAALWRWLPAWRRTRRCGAILLSVLVGYLLPTAAGYATTILLHASDLFDAVFGAIGALCVAGFLGGPALLVVLRLPTGCARHFGDPEAQAGGSAPYAVYMLADGCSDTRLMSRRLLFFEDLGVAVLISVVAGVMPADGGSCTAVTGAMAALALLHLLYSAAVRPFDKRVDGAFAVVIGAGQVAAAAAAVGATLELAHATAALACIALAQMCVFFAQLAALVAIEVYEQCVQPRLEASADDGGDAPAAEADGALVPLLPVASAVAAVAVAHDRGTYDDGLGDPFTRSPSKTAAAGRVVGTAVATAAAAGSLPNPPPVAAGGPSLVPAAAAMVGFGFIKHVASDAGSPPKGAAAGVAMAAAAAAGSPSDGASFFQPAPPFLALADSLDAAVTDSDDDLGHLL
jgi:hypothetical protein